MSPPDYATMISAKDKPYRFALRRQMVLDAKEHGIKATARRWKCVRNTVRLWIRRYAGEGLSGLKERSHAPASCPHKTSQLVEEQVLQARRRSGFGARRLKMEFDLPCGVEAIGRILRQRQLTRKPKTKRQKKNDLRAVKALLKPFERVQLDVKYLRDIAHYLPQMHSKGLPRYQYTIRDVRTGLQYLAYGQDLSMSHATVAVARFLGHLKANGLSLPDVAIQTDNGSEFDGPTEKPRAFGFTHTVETLAGASHRFIPPGCPNANAEVESAHNLIETEFYDREDFENLADFLAKAWSYQCYFNLARKNSYQQWRTPLERLRLASDKIPDRVALLAPVFLDTLLPKAVNSRPRYDALTNSDSFSRLLPFRASRQGGQHQPEYPECVPRSRRSVGHVLGLGRRGCRPANHQVHRIGHRS